MIFAQKLRNPIYRDVLQSSDQISLYLFNSTHALILVNVLFPVRLTKKLEERREQRKRGEEEVRRP